MYGFQICINGRPRQKNGDILYTNVECRNYMINKFTSDKIFWESEDFIIILDGVILNKKELVGRESKKSWADTIVSLYNKDKKNFFNELRGSFAGAVYDKSDDKLIVFTDQLGSKFVYYSLIGGVFMVSQMGGGECMNS